MMLKKLTIDIVMAVLCQKKLKAYWLLALGCVLLVGQLRAQNLVPLTNDNKIKALKVGDRIPANFWKQQYSVYQNGKTVKQDLSAYKDKLLILDFWATWCGPCVSAFPKLESYQQKFAERLAVVLISAINTQDKEGRVDKVLLGNGKDVFGLPCIRKDSVLLKTFPHVVIPHYVWIADGSVRAITTAEWLTENNVVNVLNASEKLNKPLTKKQGL